MFHDAEVKIFQDLSNITLQCRKELRPHLDLLRSKPITYHWKFPFCLLATSQGRTANLRVPEDLDHFCNILEIPIIDLLDWYSDFCLPPPGHATSMEDIREAGHRDT